MNHGGLQSLLLIKRLWNSDGAARRKEIQGICNDLLDNFVSRNNDLYGFWALGFFQKYLQNNALDELYFDLISISRNEETSFFDQTSTYYRNALQRLLKARGLPSHWVDTGSIQVHRTSPTKLMCQVDVKTDLGKVYSSQTHVSAHSHNPFRESRRGVGKYGPSNQKGQ